VAALAAMPNAAIDTNDISEVRDWHGATRGRFYRPVKKAGHSRTPTRAGRRAARG
jgi:hypothetical protein